jgi:hypothetical protein
LKTVVHPLLSHAGRFADNQYGYSSKNISSIGVKLPVCPVKSQAPYCRVYRTV